MPRGKNTNVYMTCKNKRVKKKGQKEEVCNMQNYKTRINKRTITGKLEHKKYCRACNKATMHASGSEIKHSS